MAETKGKTLYQIVEEQAKSVSVSKKFDSNKPRLDLTPVEFNIGVAKAFGLGADKYGKYNFRDPGMDYTRLLAAAIRHLQLELAGIETDKESSLDHWMHAGASIAMYAFMKCNRPDKDDRYKYTDDEKRRIEEMMYGKES
jgi:hypothetical protein